MMLRIESVEGSLSKVCTSSDPTKGNDQGLMSTELTLGCNFWGSQHPLNTTERLIVMESAISEWNEGFFKPRGIQITTNARKRWNPNLQEKNRRRVLGLRPFIEAGPQGFRMGPIIVNQPFPSSITKDITCRPPKGK